jgi:hypothetical protein
MNEAKIIEGAFEEQVIQAYKVFCGSWTVASNDVEKERAKAAFQVAIKNARVLLALAKGLVLA